jgi:hypothetical protein
MLLEALHRIVDHRESLSREEARAVMGEVLSGHCTDPQIAALLVGGWPIQARFWLEWGSSIAGENLPFSFTFSCCPFRLDLYTSVSTLPFGRLSVTNEHLAHSS